MQPTHGTQPSNIKVGYEINFNRHFYKPQPMRSLDEIAADILALETARNGRPYGPTHPNLHPVNT